MKLLALFLTATAWAQQPIAVYAAAVAQGPSVVTRRTTTALGQLDVPATPGVYVVWVDGSGSPRWGSLSNMLTLSTSSSDTDGTVVGSQS